MKECKNCLHGEACILYADNGTWHNISENCPAYAPTSRWIPVAASLPEPDRFVLGVVNGTHGGITFKNALQLVEYDGRHWYLDGYPKIGAVSVSHWMPLPPLPKEVQP